MESRNKFILGFVILFIVLTSGKNFLAKMSGKKAPRTAEPAEVSSSDLPTEKSVAVKAPVEKTVPKEASVVTPVSASAPAKVEVVTQTAGPKVATPASEVVVPVDLCRSEWEKIFCTKFSPSLGFKGAKLSDNKLIIVVNSDPYIFRAKELLNSGSPVDPTKALAQSSGAPPAAGSAAPVEDAHSDQEKKEMASALLLKEIMHSVKQEMSSKELTLIFLKDALSPVSPPTFAVACSGPDLSNYSSDIFADDKLRLKKVEVSNFCKLN